MGKCQISREHKGTNKFSIESTVDTVIFDTLYFRHNHIQGKKWAGTRRYGVPADAMSVPADGASEIVKFTISIPRESCTNAKAKFSSSVVPPDPSVHFYH